MTGLHPLVNLTHGFAFSLVRHPPKLETPFLAFSGLAGRWSKPCGSTSLLDDVPFEQGTFDHVLGRTVIYRRRKSILPRSLGEIRCVSKPGGGDFGTMLLRAPSKYPGVQDRPQYLGFSSVGGRSPHQSRVCVRNPGKALMTCKRGIPLQRPDAAVRITFAGEQKPNRLGR